jgi:hypothetical protein
MVYTSASGRAVAQRRGRASALRLGLMVLLAVGLAVSLGLLSRRSAASLVLPALAAAFFLVPLLVQVKSYSSCSPVICLTAKA